MTDGDKHMKLSYCLEFLLLRYLRWPMMTWDIMELTGLICYLKGYITGKVKTKCSKTYTEMLSLPKKK